VLFPKAKPANEGIRIVACPATPGG
jgi:hypothetical protein